MFRSLVLAAMAAAALAAPVGAEETTMTRPIEAGSLHAGPLDMVAYWVAEGDGAGYRVTATFAPRLDRPARPPMRVVLALAEGDDVAFAMPGYPEALYRFRRSGGAVTVSVRPVALGSAGTAAGL
jgi:hypothetical protein